MNKKGHVLNAVLLSIGLGYLLEPSGSLETFRTIVMIGVPVTLGALFPDVDTAFGKHRKTLHNLPILLGFLAFPYVFGNLEYVWVGVLTHYVLDVAGSKRGIALFYPLWKKEFGLPIGVAVSSKRSDLMMVIVTVAELALVALVVFRIPQWGFELGRQGLGL
ncbi:metal-dependent hydrolase [Natrinema thermotolerans]|uniref:Metal-dependent hydrolase n=1 Tax=Natrinema thermotolerans TaxID=121872 RepID=A0AAF0P8U3_9EURY|nr:metal-dependent hydrolase [Natrinema thermotolerans]QCC60080.1 metal-dependent hydrolase [Natrinema thermotolerans]QCC60999.1 metal-dependent hydrolase [Natrinema thermotolerans]WMT07087.1 metal-dependent hydrolase [Natrinema thermotolerans]